MDSAMSGGSPDIQVVGFRCTLFDDPEKYIETNNGKMLVPWADDASITIDRFDCRGYLHDLREYDADNIVHKQVPMTPEEVQVEELCNYERYLEMHSDIYEEAILKEEEAKRETEASKGTFAAVHFSYDAENRAPETDKVQNGQDATQINTETEPAQESIEQGDPYVCPPELILPPDMVLPDFEKQAAIIEKTAVFIARNNAQMEIVLKAKQSNNPQFRFLNYDDKLNPFYKELVKLIKSGRYIPRRNTALDEPKHSHDPQEQNFVFQTNSDEPYELKLPKVDISNTPYASLINRFKKSAAEKFNSGGSVMENGKSNDDAQVNGDSGGTDSKKEEEKKPKGALLNTIIMTEADYERCYQDYYRYYYSHYYMHYAQSAQMGADPATESWLVAEAVKAAATSASAAVNAMRQSQITKSATPPADLQGIIDKMAEYVARNGDEFQEVVRKQKAGDARFDFLQTEHVHHEYYLTKRREFAAKFQSSKEKDNSTIATGNETNESLKVEIKTSSSSLDRTKSISFRLAKSGSSNRLRDMEERPNTPPPPPPITTDGDGTSSSCVLPGMSNYTDSEDEQETIPEENDAAASKTSNDEKRKDEKLVTTMENPTPSEPPTAADRVSPVVTVTTTLSADSTKHPSPVSQKVRPGPSSSRISPPKVGQSGLTSEQIARDIRSMEEEARLQLERRKRAALFAAKLQQARLMGSHRNEKSPSRGERARSRSRSRSSSRSPYRRSRHSHRRRREEGERDGERKKRETEVVLAVAATAAPPPPPSSVPPAVANALAAQLEIQRQKALEAAGAVAAERKNAEKMSRSPPAAYARQRRRRRSSSSTRSSRSSSRVDSASRRRRSHSRRSCSPSSTSSGSSHGKRKRHHRSHRHHKKGRK